MKRELFIHYSYWFGFFVLIALFKHYFAINAWGFWVGGIVGTLLPDIDHIIYFYFVGPQELTSQRFDYMAHNHKIKRMLGLLYETRTERKGLIFHTIFFQAIFLLLTFWMLSSSGSLIGKGLVLSFALHLTIDQWVDVEEIGSLKNWIKNLPLTIDAKQTTSYLYISTVLLILLGLFI